MKFHEILEILMKELFKGYFEKSNSEIQQIWHEGLISFDTSILFNLYEYSAQSRTEILNTVKNKPDKFFLTFQTVKEYRDGRMNTISKIVDAHDNLLKSTKAFFTSVQAKEAPPHFSQTLLSDINKIKNNINKEIENSKKEFNNILFKKDTILDEIIGLFDKKVVEKYSDDRLAEIYKQGEIRYQNNIPPGWRDAGKGSFAKYGDLIIWMQLIDQAKLSKRPIIFITSDKKEDWFWKIRATEFKNRPHPDLVRELWEAAKVEFLLYTFEQYLEAAKIYLKADISQTTIDQVKAVAEQEKSAKFDSLMQNDIAKWLDNESTYDLELDVFMALTGEYFSGFDSDNIREISHLPKPDRFLYYKNLERTIDSFIYTISHQIKTYERLEKSDQRDFSEKEIERKGEYLNKLKELQNTIRLVLSALEKEIGGYFVDKDGNIVMKGERVMHSTFGEGTVFTISNGLVRVVNFVEGGAVNGDFVLTPDELVKIF